MTRKQAIVTRISYYFDSNGYSDILQATHQITTTCNKSQRLSIFLICDKPLQFALSCAILPIDLIVKETHRDYNGRRNLLHTRRDCQVTEDGRGFSNTALTPEENTCLQNQWAVAYRSRRVQDIHGKEQEHSRGQIKKASPCQQSNNNLAAQGLSVDWNPDDNPLSSLRRLLRILPYVVRCCQPLGNILAAVGWQWRCIR